MRSMTADGRVNPRIRFFSLFRTHWEQGTGQKRTDACWAHRTFSDAIGRAGINTIDPATVDDWLAGTRLPLKSRKDAILRVFFGDCEKNPALRQERDDLDAAWHAASSQIRSERRQSSDAAEADATTEWRTYAATYVNELVELRLSKPRFANDLQSLYLEGTLQICSTEYETDGRYFKIGIRSAFLSVNSQSHQLVVGSMIGNRSPSEQYRRRPGGIEIVGPLDEHGCLQAHLFGDEYIAVMEPIQHGDEWISATLKTSSRNFVAQLIEGYVSDECQADKEAHGIVHLEKDAIINILINKDANQNGRIKRDSQGRPILAEAIIRRGGAQE